MNVPNSTLRSGKLGWAAASIATASVALASVFVSGIGASAAGAAKPKFCTDYANASKVSNLKQLKKAIPELKKLEAEAPGAMNGELKQFVVFVQQLATHNGKFTSKSQSTAFGKLSTKLESQTTKLCK
jgi:hypothetical protein